MILMYTCALFVGLLIVANLYTIGQVWKFRIILRFNGKAGRRVKNLLLLKVIN